jgi:tripartite-type tricarboxylate transporter receptor subunit TctC
MRFLVPYPVGGIVDIVTRCLADPMQVDLGQPVVVEPKPGGNSTLATALIPQAPADGYNWLMATISHVVVPHLQSVPYDPLADFQPMALVAVATSVATVNPSLPVKTLNELVEYGKANPGTLNYLNPGNGSSIHLSAELLKNRYKFDMTSVPYRGIPPGISDLIEGRLQVGLLPGPLAIQHVLAGKLRALAVLADQRLPTLPDAGRHGGRHRRAVAWLGDEIPAAGRNARQIGQGRLRGAGAARPCRRGDTVEGRRRALRQTGQRGRYQGRNLTAK